MRIFPILYWTLFVFAILFFIWQYLYVLSWGQKLDIFGLEFASNNEGRMLLQEWNRLIVDTENILHYAHVNTWVDLLFIIGYVGVAVLISKSLMQSERNQVFNEIIRMCYLLAFLIGFLVVVENIILLSDMYHYREGKAYVSPALLSTMKFVIVACLFLIWLIALIRRWANNKVPYHPEKEKV
jgi:hypothetical protein